MKESKAPNIPGRSFLSWPLESRASGGRMGGSPPFLPLDPTTLQHPNHLRPLEDHRCLTDCVIAQPIHL